MANMEEKYVEMWNDMENMEKSKSNSETIRKLWKKSKLKCEKDMRNMEEKYFEYWKDIENMEE
jgi:uncharacterized protein (DUF305 family)